VRGANRQAAIRFTTEALGLEGSSQILFDDFNYSNYKQLAKHGWTHSLCGRVARDAGATWGNKAVSFPADPDQRGNRLLRMTSSTDGTGANTHQSQICHQRKYLEGTLCRSCALC